MYIYQSIKHFTAAFLFATGGYAAQAQTTDAGIMPFLGLETNARTAGMAGAATAVADNPLAVYANAALSLIGERHAGGACSPDLGIRLSTAPMCFTAWGDFILPTRGTPCWPECVISADLRSG